MINKRNFLKLINLYISLRFLFNSPSWQKSPVNSVRVQSQIGPSSVAMQTPSFLQGLPLAQALTVLDRTPCKKKTEHISISPRFSSRHPWWLGKLCNGVALFVVQAKKTYGKVISDQENWFGLLLYLVQVTFRAEKLPRSLTARILLDPYNSVCQTCRI